MSTFSRDEITFFREQYANHLKANARGVNVEGFLGAIQLCIDHAGLYNPGEGMLRADFDKIRNTDGTVSWPQFFQALQKIRNTQQPSGPQEQEDQQETQGERRVRISEGNQGRTLRRTLRRGVIAAGSAVGNWFGVTEPVNDTDVFFDEASIVETGRRSFRRAQQPPPPEVEVQYIREDDVGPTEPIIFASTNADIQPSANLTQSSFAFVDFEGDSDDSEVEERDNFLVQPAPPNYLDIVGGEPPRPSSMPPQSERVPVSTDRPLSFEIPPEILQEALLPADIPADIPQRDPGFIYDPQRAFQYYQGFVKEERKALRNRAQRHARSFFGGDNPPSDPIIGGNNIQRNDNLRGSGRGNRISQREGGWRDRLRFKRNDKKLQRQSTMVRQEVASLPTFCPFFTILITIAQIVCFLVLIILNGLAPVNIHPEEHIVTVPTLSDSSIFVTKTITRGTNMWIGSSVVNMIQWGAKFKPCMRGDEEITRRNSRDSEAEAGPLGCCCNGQYYGSTVQSDCAGGNNTDFSPSDLFTNSTNCVGFSPGVSCGAQGVRPLPNITIFRPCCVSITGACVVVSEHECTLRGGIPHSNQESCRDINCLRNVCGFNGTNIPEQRALATQEGEDAGAPNQFWRWITPVFFHLGIIHLILVMIVQVFVGVKIELYAGWLRVGIIYFISALGGLLVSSIFIPYEVYFGASGAVCGLLAVYLIELLQKWKIKDYACIELIVFIVLSAIVLFFGTFPYVDNFVHFGGFLFGLLAALIFMPWVTFTKNTRTCRCIILLVAVPTLLVLTVFALLVFYLLPDAQSNFCPWCHYINCIPYFPDLCSITNPTPEGENLPTVGL